MPNIRQRSRKWKLREWRKYRRFCQMCGQRKARFFRIVKKRTVPTARVRSDRTHRLCRRCFESVSDSVRARQLNRGGFYGKR